MEWYLRFSLLSGFFMALVFFSMGIALLSLPEFLPEARPPWRNYAGWFLIVWAMFRLMLTWMRFKKFKNQD